MEESELVRKIIGLEKDSRVLNVRVKGLLYNIYLHKNPTLPSETIQIFIDNGLERPQISVPPKYFFNQTPLDSIPLHSIYFGYEIFKDQNRKLHLLRFDYVNSVLKRNA